MVAEKAKAGDVAEMSVKDKLKALYDLQQVDTDIDKIKILRGELPLDVSVRKGVAGYPHVQAGAQLGQILLGQGKVEIDRVESL